MTEVEDYIFSLEGEQQKIMLYYHKILSAFPRIKTKIRYKVPFYDGKSWICYLSPIKKGGVEIAFVRGNELSNSQKILDYKKRKMVRGFTASSLKEIPMKKINEIIHEALMLDEVVPHSFKPKK